MDNEVYKDRKKFKVLMIALILFLGVGVVAGAWLIYFQSGITGMSIFSESNIIGFEDDFTIEDFDTSNSSANLQQTLSIENKDGDREVKVEWITTITNLTDVDTCNFTDDIDVRVSYVNCSIQEISNGVNILVLGGSNSNLTINTTAKDKACPQLVGTQVTITEV